MKNALILSLLAVFATGCLSIQTRLDRARFGDNPYLEAPFYARYLDTGSQLDRDIQAYLGALREAPEDPVFHNELGRLLVLKGFPNDAEREFRRALASDPDFYPAWYNLGLLRASRSQYTGALRALERTLDEKPGHAAALFQKGLILERQGRTENAIEAYAKAFRINFDLLQPKVNPQIIDSSLTARALLRIYSDEHRRRALQMQPTPPQLIQERRAPSEVPSPDEIVAPVSHDPEGQTQRQTPAPPPGG
jgi:tetratricopeptide (TPR) repeat protein